MKMQHLIGLSLAFISLNASASFKEPDQDRMQVIKQYVLDLEKADATDISQLFVKNGLVVSTSRGKVDANNFFNAFLPNISTAKTELHHVFKSPSDSRRYMARFHFSFTLNDGEQGDGEYVDEFEFAGHSAKLKSVLMFENLKFPVEMQ